jgi:pSer/pThr/pTyr-binding forkhead associated (FHA) protein
MARCIQCQHENIEGALFCDQCGANLDEDLPLSQVKPRHHTSSLVEPDLRATGQERPETIILDDRDEEGTDDTAKAEATPPDSFYLVTSSGRRIPVPPLEQVILGRADSRSGVRPDIDLSVEAAQQAGVSRRHCRLIWRSDKWLVEDLMSTNYTLVNGTRLASHTPTPIAAGDELRLGKLVLTLGQGTNVG